MARAGKPLAYSFSVLTVRGLHENENDIKSSPACIYKCALSDIKARTN